MTTGLGIITRALQKAGVLTKTEAPSPDEANDALSDLNNMIASWSNQSLIVYAKANETFNLQSGVASYTWGLGGAFNSARPMNITSIEVNFPPLTALPVELITNENYALIVTKSTLGVPTVANNSNEYPLSVLTFYPVPQSNYTVTINSEKQLSSIPDLYTTISLPPGWEHALIHNLSVILAPEYGVEAPQTVQTEAVKSKGNIMREVAKNYPLDWPGAVPLLGNIYNGFFRPTGL